MNRIALFILCLLSQLAAGQTAQLKFTPDFILDAVATKMNVKLDTKIAAPQIHFESSSQLIDFQNAVEKQWGFRPDAITNVFITEANEIYLIDDANYYQRTKRFMDDSLAHELTHFIQVRYQSADLSDDTLELEAVEVQTWFRETYLK